MHIEIWKRFWWQEVKCSKQNMKISWKPSKQFENWLMRTIHLTFFSDLEKSITKEASEQHKTISNKENKAIQKNSKRENSKYHIYTWWSQLLFVSFFLIFIEICRRFCTASLFLWNCATLAKRRHPPCRKPNDDRILFFVCFFFFAFSNHLVYTTLFSMEYIHHLSLCWVLSSYYSEHCYTRILL